MMNGLFSMFDPHYTNSLMIYSIPFLMILMNLTESSKNLLVTKKAMKLLYKEMNPIFPNSFMLILLSNIFMTNSFMNLLSMTPYSFTMNSMMSIVFPLAMTMFMLIISAKMVKTPKTLMSHLVPKGSPMMLSPLMVIIELTSLLIRPITLSVRLMANMTAGHLLIHLISMAFFSMKQLSMILPFMSLMLLMAEVFIALIQAYIFTMLLTIYLAE